eukprot:651731-Hanusia_phi.AAC.1
MPEGARGEGELGACFSLAGSWLASIACGRLWTWHSRAHAQRGKPPSPAAVDSSSPHAPSLGGALATAAWNALAPAAPAPGSVADAHACLFFREVGSALAAAIATGLARALNLSHAQARAPAPAPAPARAQESPSATKDDRFVAGTLQTHS